MSYIETKGDLLANSLGTFEAELKSQNNLLNNLQATTAAIQTNLQSTFEEKLNLLVNLVNSVITEDQNLKAKVDTQTSLLSNLQAGSNSQVELLAEFIANQKMQATTLSALEAGLTVQKNSLDNFEGTAIRQTKASQSVSLEVYTKYRQCTGMIESDKGNLEIEPSNSSCLSVIKLQNTTGFYLELDPIMTESILVIPEHNATNSNAQSIWISGSKNVLYEFKGSKLAIVVLPGRDRMTFNWRGLVASVSENKSTKTFVNDAEGTMEWEPSWNGSGKIFWEFSHEMPVQLNWTLNTDSAVEAQENPCENMLFSVMQIRPDGSISEIQKTCDGSSEGSIKLERHSELVVILHIKSEEATRSKLRVSWAQLDESLKKIESGIVTAIDTTGVYVMPFNSSQTKLVASGYIRGLTFDWNSRRIYYLQNEVGIKRSNLDGSGSEVIVSDSSKFKLYGMTIEPTTGNLYYGNRSSRTIRVCNNDAKKCSTLATTSNSSYARDLAVHQSKGLLFWSIENEQVVRANLDGSNATIILERKVRGIDVDENEDRVYWSYSGGIGSCDMNGQNIRLVPNTAGDIWDVAIENDKVHYVTWDKNGVYVTSKLGTNSRMVAQFPNDVEYMVLFGMRVSNKLANPCDQAECAHLCVLVTRWTYRCTCPDGQVLSTDGKTCNI